MINKRTLIFFSIIVFNLTVCSYNPFRRSSSFAAYTDFFIRGEEFILRSGQSGINRLLRSCKPFTRFSFFQANGELKITPWITLASLCVFLEKTNSLRNTILFHVVEPFFDLNKSFYSEENKKFFHISKIVAVSVNSAFYYSAKYGAHLFKKWLNNNSTSKVFEKKDIPVLLFSVALSAGAIAEAAYITETAFSSLRDLEPSFFRMDKLKDETERDYLIRIQKRKERMEKAYKSVNKNVHDLKYVDEIVLAVIEAKRDDLPINMLPAGRKRCNAIYDKIIKRDNEKKLLAYHQACIEKQEKDEKKHVTGLPNTLMKEVLAYLSTKNRSWV